MYFKEVPLTRVQLGLLCHIITSYLVRLLLFIELKITFFCCSLSHYLFILLFSGETVTQKNTHIIWSDSINTK